MQPLHERRAPRPTRRPEAPFGAPGQPGTPAAELAADEAGVEVIWGALPDRYDLAGVTVVEADRLLRAHLGIPGGVRALLNGAEAEATRRLRPGDVLEFVRAAGERGGR
jgi:hypothetical protein